MLAQKNLNLTTKIRYMSRKTTREKLISYLSAQALRANSSEFEIPLDRQQLADFLGVERSAMSATLGRLRDEGALTFHKNRFHLLQRDEED
jgi:CRP-like cAMP-binding protein